MLTARHSRMFLAFLTSLIVAAAIGTPAGAATSHGLIMKEGNVCDPIRHMGC
jgi:hypothetical protein